MEYTVSDHKPVSSIFTLQVRHLTGFLLFLMIWFCKKFHETGDLDNFIYMFK